MDTRRIVLHPQTRAKLERKVRRCRDADTRVRYLIALRTDRGHSGKRIARELGCCEATVSRAIGRHEDVVESKTAAFPPTAGVFQTMKLPPDAALPAICSPASALGFQSPIANAIRASRDSRPTIRDRFPARMLISHDVCPVSVHADYGRRIGNFAKDCAPATREVRLAFVQQADRRAIKRPRQAAD